MKLARQAFEFFLVGLMLLFEGVLILEEKRALWFRRRAHRAALGTLERLRPAPIPVARDARRPALRR